VDNPDQVADLIGMSAVIIQDMSAKRHMNYDYNVDRMTRFEVLSIAVCCQQLCNSFMFNRVKLVLI